MIYYYTYLITNTKEKKFYIGSRQCEIDPIKDLGVKYFSSSTDKDFIGDQKQNPNDYEYRVLGLFTNSEDALLDEMELHETYNVSRNSSFYNKANCTSTGFNTSGKVTAKDKDGKITQVAIDDPRFLEMELVGVTKGTVPVKDKDGNNMRVLDDDLRYLSGELDHVSKGTVTVKDKGGNTMRVPVNDPRYNSGELTPIWVGKHHSDETKGKMGRAQSGSSNSQYGKMWITNPTEKKNLKIKKTDPIPAGWTKGRKMGY